MTNMRFIDKTVKTVSDPVTIRHLTAHYCTVLSIITVSFVIIALSPASITVSLAMSDTVLPRPETKPVYAVLLSDTVLHGLTRFYSKCMPGPGKNWDPFRINEKCSLLDGSLGLGWINTVQNRHFSLFYKIKCSTVVIQRLFCHCLAELTRFYCLFYWFVHPDPKPEHPFSWSWVQSS